MERMGKETFIPNPGGPGWSELAFRHLCTQAQVGSTLHPASRYLYPVIYKRPEELPGRETRVHIKFRHTLGSMAE